MKISIPSCRGKGCLALAVAAMVAGCLVSAAAPTTSLADTVDDRDSVMSLARSEGVAVKSSSPVKIYTVGKVSRRNVKVVANTVKVLPKELRRSSKRLYIVEEGKWAEHIPDSMYGAFASPSHANVYVTSTGWSNTELFRAVVSNMAHKKLDSKKLSSLWKKERAALEALDSSRDEIHPEPVDAADHFGAVVAYGYLGSSWRATFDSECHGSWSLATRKFGKYYSAKVSNYRTLKINIKDAGDERKAQAAVYKAAVGDLVRTVVFGKKVKSISDGTFYSCPKVGKIKVKTRKLTRKSVKGCFSNYRASQKITVIVDVGNHARNIKYAKRYAKYFAKKNSGHKVKVVAA